MKTNRVPFDETKLDRRVSMVPSPKQKPMLCNMQPI